MITKNHRTGSGRKSHVRRRIFGWIAGIILLSGIAAGFAVFGPNTGKLPGQYLFIHTGDTYKKVLLRLKSDGFLLSGFTFDLLAKYTGYPKMVKPGRYRMERSMSNYDMIRMLRNGSQEPVRIVINKIRTKDDMTRFLSGNLEADADELKRLMDSDTFLSRFGLTPEQAICGIIPDTYEFWWNTPAAGVLTRLFQYQQKFWTPERIAQAEALGLSTAQVYIMASIVEEESNKNDEKPDIASVYINRLNIGMPLQADPTVKFAWGDFSIKRVMGNHLKLESPYNTYLYAGLPPGPICTPSVISIDAVLHASKTNYLYFCARPDFSGYHTFSTNYATHLIHARAYAKALNEKGIR